MVNAALPHEIEVVERIQESPTIFTLRLRFTDPVQHAAFRFEPGQFNMLYLYGVGEVPISIVSDPEDEKLFDHTIRVVGRVTRGLGQLKARDRLGMRGPYGRGWPLKQAEGHDVMIITGGLGCAPVVSVINYVIRRRDRFRRLIIMQGVKHSDDLIWRSQYSQWSKLRDTQVLVAADVGVALWPWHIGRVTELFDQVEFDPSQAMIMMCGPQGMMRVAVDHLLRRGVTEDHIHLSMERNMHCAVGHCGHCQYGGKFVCQDGPVFSYAEARPLFGIQGF
ncbi:Ni/Fe hydrogenase subunit gamma [Sulfuricaulis limicola]|uniref:Ni/Fe hydrogenase subunit gamma n=1 Tax=Sulfuricaulis limicola TaxID=1620215 RepID=A0A1B4XHY8_9GAMM|nr:FAD/NAD(P)-binding protein [Sulfuricaulis limicola]BAV34415.1 Ni/Fe hydrogenase subunit gamma [Sulfuricaulis limicola]